MSASPENLCLHLHENMCNFSDDIESLCKAADYLSHADMLVQWQVIVSGIALFHWLIINPLAQLFATYIS
jgi:hypothetical protein